MIAQGQRLKHAALSLRIKGRSIGDIERKLDIPRSTLSGWLKDIKLTKDQKLKLFEKSLKSLANARKKAIMWHNLQKEGRLLEAKKEAIKVLGKLNINNKAVLELALSMLYLGEGSKKNLTSLGNTNPTIMMFFLNSIRILYDIKPSDVRCELHLRNDQSGSQMIKYWSRQLNLKTHQFIAIKDNRKVKSKTYTTYKGVCVVRCGKIALQRRLVFLSEGFCNKIAQKDD